MSRLIVVLFLIFTYLYSFPGERDFELWNQNTVEVGLAEKTFLIFSEKLHYTPHTNSIGLKFADTRIQYDVTPWFTLGSGFRFSWIRQDIDWLQEQRPMVYGTLSSELCNFELDFSNRIEYRFLNKEINHFRHWQKVIVNFPDIPRTRLQFFTAFESFYKLNREKLHMIRLHAGVNAINRKNFEMKIFYACQKSKSILTWDITDIIGVNLNIDL
jgi:hypothetical protein